MAQDRGSQAVVGLRVGSVRFARICVHAGTCSLARASPGSLGDGQQTSGLVEAAIVRGNQAAFGRAPIAAIGKIDGAAEAREAVLSVLARRWWLRSKSV